MSNLGVRLRRFAISAALATLIVGAVVFIARGTLLSALGHQLVRVDPLVKADAIVVFGGGTPQREIAAADLYLAQYAPRVVIALTRDSEAEALARSRGIQIETENELKQRILHALGVPDTAVTVLHETRPTSTKMEAVVVRRWAVENGARRIIVVTSPFHTARTSFVFRRALRNDAVEVVVRPASHEEFDPQRWWTDRVQLKNGVIELQKLLFYYVAYWWD